MRITRNFTFWNAQLLERVRQTRRMLELGSWMSLPKVHFNAFYNLVGGVALLLIVLWRPVIVPWLRAVAGRALRTLVRGVWSVLLITCAAYLLWISVVSTAISYSSTVLEHSRLVWSTMETGASAAATSKMTKGLAAASFLGWAALKPSSKSRGGRPGQATQSTEDVKPVITTPVTAAPQVHVCAVEESEAKTKKERERMLRILDNKLEDKMKCVDEDFGDLFARVKSLEKYVKNRKQEEENKATEKKLKQQWKDIDEKFQEKLVERVEALEEQLEEHDGRLDELGIFYTRQKAMMAELKRELRWFQDSVDNKLRPFTNEPIPSYAIASLLPAEPEVRRWASDDEEESRAPQQQTPRQHVSPPPRVNFEEPPARREDNCMRDDRREERREERYDARHERRYEVPHSERRYQSPNPRREDPELERLKYPDVPLPADLCRRYPERLVMQVLNERKRRRPRPPGSGYYLSEEEISVAKRSLAELCVMWRRFRCMEDGKPLREYEWDRWDLGYLNEEECRMQRADIKRIIERRREDVKARLAAERGQPQSLCPECGAWHGANKKCVAANNAAPTKRPGVMEKTILQAYGKNNLAVKTMQVPDGEELRKEATRLRAIKQGVEDREALAEALSKDVRADGGLPPKSLSTESYARVAPQPDDRMTDERRSF